MARRLGFVGIGVPGVPVPACWGRVPYGSVAEDLCMYLKGNGFYILEGNDRQARQAASLANRAGLSDANRAATGSGTSRFS